MGARLPYKGLSVASQLFKRPYGLFKRLLLYTEAQRHRVIFDDDNDDDYDHFAVASLLA